MPITPIGGAPYPETADADSVPSDLMALAAWASTRVGMSFEDAAARSAAIPDEAARPGMLAWLDNPGALTVRNAAGWKTLWSSLNWTDITLETGYSTYGTPPQAALDGGNFIALRGAVQKTAAGTQITGDSVIGSIPASFGTPLSGDYAVATQWVSGRATGRLYVATNRQLKYVGDPVAWAGLNGVRIPIT